MMYIYIYILVQDAEWSDHGVRAVEGHMHSPHILPIATNRQDLFVQDLCDDTDRIKKLRDSKDGVCC